MEKTWENSIIEAIRAYAAGFSSVRAAAEKLGTSYETFKSWHDGKKSPTIKSLSPYAEKLGLFPPLAQGVEVGQFQRRIDSLREALATMEKEKNHLEGEVSVLERLLEKSQNQIQEQARKLSSQQPALLPNGKENNKTSKVV